MFDKISLDNTVLKGWEGQYDAQLPIVFDGYQQVYHMYYLLIPKIKLRQIFIASLTVFNYLPLHLSDMELRFGCRQGDCPVTEHISDQLVCLAFSNDLNLKGQQSAMEAVLEFGF